MTSMDTSTDWTSDHNAVAPYSRGTLRVGRRRIGKRAFYKQLLERLRAQRASWDPHWQAIFDVTAPRRPRFDRNSVNRTERNDKVKNSKALTATRRLVALMCSKMFSPADIWFTVSVGDDEDMKDEEVQRWVAGEEQGIRDTLEDGGFYRVIEPVLEDIVNPATGAMFAEDDLETVVRFYHLPVGSYFLAQSGRNQIDTLIRECAMTTAQLEDKFGYEACSDQVKALLDKNELSVYWPIVHAISPNTDYSPGTRYPKAVSKRWNSCWFEIAGSDNDDRLLGEDVYDDFPGIVGRWAVIGEDVWGTGSPGMDSNSDARELQECALDASEIRAMMARPAMGAPASMMGGNISIVPGSLTYLDNASVDLSIKPLVEVDGAQLEATYSGEERLEGRLGDAYYSALWGLIEESDADPRKTATEIHEYRNEKLSLLGTLAGHAHQDIAKPVVQRVWNARLRAGKVKPWPRRLIGKAIKLTFHSEFSQAQKASKAVVLARLAEVVGQLVEVTGDPTVAYNLDPRAIINLQADALGVDPTATRSGDEVDKLLQAAAEQQQKAEQEAQAGARAETLEKLSKPMGDDSIGAQLGRGVEQQRGAA